MFQVVTRRCHFLLLILLVAAIPAVQAVELAFLGDTIASQATGPQDPWFGSYAYRYLDGWNHAPRVPAHPEWAPGGHAGVGTNAVGWTSLDNANPGRYAMDFQGLEFDHNFYYHESTGYTPIDPEYRHEDRWYDPMAPAPEGTWQILDTWVGGGVVAQGTLGTIQQDIFYGANPYVAATGIITVANDGGAFYNEVITRWGANTLNIAVFTPEPPVQAVNWGDPLIDQWAIFNNTITITPIPEPGTALLLSLGGLLLGRRRSA